MLELIQFASEIVAAMNAALAIVAVLLAIGLER